MDICWSAKIPPDRAVSEQFRRGANRLPDRQLVGMGNRRFASKLALDSRMVPSKQAGEPGLPARGTLIVERIADGPQVGGRHATRFRADCRSAFVFFYIREVVPVRESARDESRVALTQPNARAGLMTIE
jgi:hypothetical protein